MTDLPPDAYGPLGARQVMRVGFGAMQLRSGDGAVLRRAVELGVDHIDTAEFYGPANELIRSTLHPYPDGLQLVSKVGVEHHNHELVPTQRPEQLRAGVEANLASLGVEQLAVVNLRRLDRGPGIIADAAHNVDLDSQLAELVALRDEGKIAAIGLSNVSHEQLRHALPAGIVCVQNGYNLLERTHEDTLAECERHGIAWVPFFPLGSASGLMPSVADHPVVVATATRLSRTPAQVGLAWLLAHSRNALLIPGTRSVDHLTDNVAVASMQLDATALAALDAL